MYIYDEIDRKMVEQHVAQFNDQTQRFLAGKLTEDEFRVLRLQNGLYIQRHAPMLRVAIPYGMQVSKQLRMLAHIAQRWDKGYGHYLARCGFDSFLVKEGRDAQSALNALNTFTVYYQKSYSQPLKASL